MHLIIFWLVYISIIFILANCWSYNFCLLNFWINYWWIIWIFYLTDYDSISIWIFYLQLRLWWIKIEKILFLIFNIISNVLIILIILNGYIRSHFCMFIIVLQKWIVFWVHYRVVFNSNLLVQFIFNWKRTDNILFLI